MASVADPDRTDPCMQGAAGLSDVCDLSGLTDACDPGDLGCGEAGWDQEMLAADWPGPGSLPGDDPGPVWPIFGELAPHPKVAALLTSVELAELDEYDLVEAVAAWERQAAYAHAQQVRALAALLRRPMFARLSSFRDGVDPVRGVGLEISARLRISVREAEQRVELADELGGERTATLAALEAGRIDYWRAKAIAEGLRVLDDPHTAAQVEEQILPVADRVTRASLRKTIAKRVAAVDPAGAEQRHERALADRMVRCAPEPDGMGSMWALLSAHDTWLLDRVLDAAAHGMKHATPDDPRTHAQRRADALAEMAQDAWRRGVIGAPDRPDDGAGVRLATSRQPEIGVLVALSTLIGLDEQPADLVGYGPIPASVARRIAADGVWRRILTDPATGAVLDVGANRYRPPAELADHVRLRDQTCRGIACTRLARSCDLDHTVPAPGGPTAAGNLCPLCRTHHNGKTHCGWQLAQPQPGRLIWRSPTGHEYERPPEQVGPILQPDPGGHDPGSNETRPVNVHDPSDGGKGPFDPSDSCDDPIGSVGPADETSTDDPYPDIPPF